MFRMKYSPAPLCTILIVSLALVPANAFAAAPDRVCVNPAGTGGCFSAIQAGVNAVAPGGVVDVRPGTYKEDVTDSQPVTLRGEDRETTIIDATGFTHALEVHTTRNVTIENLTFKNANGGGVLFDAVSQANFNHNHVTGNDKGIVVTSSGPTCPSITVKFPFDGDDCGEGVTIAGLANSVVSDNLVDGNVGGILVSDEDGATRDNLFTNNSVSNNPDDCGLTMASHSANQVFHNRLIGNTVSGNGAAGIGLFGPIPGSGVHDNLILNNTAANNGIPGVTMHSHTAGQNMNDNAIIGNTVSGNGADFTQPGASSVPAGIELFVDASGSAAPVQNTTILFNTISHESTDIWVGTNATSVEVHFNNLGAPAIGVDNAGTGAINAQLNFWGCPGGPGATGCATMSGPSITTFPFLTRPVGGGV